MINLSDVFSGIHSILIKEVIGTHNVQQRILDLGIGWVDSGLTLIENYDIDSYLINVHYRTGKLTMGYVSVGYEKVDSTRELMIDEFEELMG